MWFISSLTFVGKSNYDLQEKKEETPSLKHNLSAVQVGQTLL